MDFTQKNSQRDSLPGPLGPAAALRAFTVRYRLDISTPALVGFSGGPDSTALLAALSQVWKGPVRAVHVDHGIRPEAERAAEIELVKSLARRFGAGLTVAHIKAGAIEKKALLHGTGIEAEARIYRYRVFARMLAQSDPRAACFFLAHNRDDQLETLLMRAFSGAGTAGLRGIRPVSGPYLRPFLDIPKADLLAYLQERDIPYSMDSTNQGDDYLRNRIRHSILPQILSAMPWAGAGLLRMAAKASLDDAALAEWTARSGFCRIKNSSGERYRAPLSLLDQPEAIRQRAILTCAGQVFPGRRSSSRFAADALRALDSGAKRCRGEGLEIWRGPDGESNKGAEALFMARALDFPRPHSYFVQVDRLDSAGLSLYLGGFSIKISWTSCPGAGRIREEAVSFPFIVRSRRPGDRLFAGSGFKAVDELFSEWDIRDELRPLVPIIEDKDGLVAVLASALGSRDRFRKRDCQGQGRFIAITLKGARGFHGLQ